MLENVFPKSMFTNNRLGVRCVCCFDFISVCVCVVIFFYMSVIDVCIICDSDFECLLFY